MRFFILLILASCSKPDAPNQVVYLQTTPLTTVSISVPSKKIDYCAIQVQAEKIVQDLKRIEKSCSKLDRHSLNGFKGSQLQVDLINQLKPSIESFRDIRTVFTPLISAHTQLKLCASNVSTIYESDYWKNGACKEFQYYIGDAIMMIDHIPCDPKDE